MHMDNEELMDSELDEEEDEFSEDDDLPFLKDGEPDENDNPF